MNRGKREVRSQPAETLLAAIFVPSYHDTGKFERGEQSMAGMGTHLRQNERGRDKPDTEPRRAAWMSVKELVQEVDRRPDRLAVDDLGRRGDDDTEEGDQ